MSESVNVGPLKCHLLLDVLSFLFGFDPNCNLVFSWKFILGNLFKSTGSLTLKGTRVCFISKCHSFKRNLVDFILHCKFEKVVLLQFCLLCFN